MRHDWSKFENIVYQDDKSLSKRKSSWTAVCNDCNKNRKISYCQAFNIIKNLNSLRCQSCAEKNKPTFSGINLNDNRVNKLDIELSDFQSKWECFCEICNKKQITSYVNIVNKISNNNFRCLDCSLKDRWENDIEYKNKLHSILIERNTNNNPAKKDIVKEKMRNAKLGKFGKNANNWDGGKTQERKLLSNRDEYKKLRIFVFTRDNYTCKICGIRGGKLEMDHIKEWCNYPELRFNSDNCRTLCKECHKKTDNYGSKAKKLKVELYGY